MSDMDKHQDPATLRPGMCARDENGHMLPHDCGQERHSQSVINPAHMCSCGQPTWAHEERYCTPPRDEHDDERRNYPKTCAEAGPLCIDMCTLRGQDETIMDPDCFRGPSGRERLAMWRRMQASKVNADGDIIDWREASIAAGPQERELPDKVSLVPNEWAEQERELPTPSIYVTLPNGERAAMFPAPINLPQCRFCGGPGHAYGERCLRDLSGRSFNLTSPSARLGYAITQLRGLRTLNAEYVDNPGATTTAKFAEGVLKHTVDALDAVHEALADLYSGRL